MKDGLRRIHDFCVRTDRDPSALVSLRSVDEGREPLASYRRKVRVSLVAFASETHDDA